MVDLTKKKTLGEYETEALANGDTVVARRSTNAVGEKVFLGDIVAGTAASIAEGTSTALKMYSDKALKDAVNTGAIPVGTDTEIETGTDTTAKLYAPDQLNSAINSLIETAVPDGTEAQIIAGTDTTERKFTPADINGAVKDIAIAQYAGRTAMKAITGLTAGDVVYLSEGGRSGTFETLPAGDYSAEIAADPLEGVYVLLGNGQVVKRRLNGYVTPEMFGYLASDTNHDSVFGAFISSTYDSICERPLNFTVTDVFESSLSNKKIDLNGSNFYWNGTADLSNDDRNLGFITVSPESEGNILIEAPTGGLSYMGSSFTTASPELYSIGGYLRISGVTAGDNSTGIYPSIDRICKVVGISGSEIKTDTTFGWNVESGSYSTYSYNPIFNVHVGSFNFHDQQPVTLSANTTSKAPLAERNKAVCALVVRGVINPKVEKIHGNGTKFPLVKFKNCRNIDIDDINCESPDWVGPGEGYSVQVGQSANIKKSNVRGNAVRHVSDFTGSAFATVKNSHGTNGRQNDFITHGAFEHDITYEDCYGSVFAPASAGVADFGNFAHSINVVGGAFDSLFGNSIDVSFSGTKINEMQIQTFASVSLTNNTKVFNFLSAEADAERLGNIQNVLPGFDYGYFVLDESSSLSISNFLSGGSNNRIKDYKTVRLNGNLISLRDVPSSLSLDSNGASLISAISTNMRLRCYGDFKSVDVSSSVFNHDILGTGGNFVFTQNLSGADKTVTISKCKFNLNKNGGTTGTAYSLRENGEAAPVSVKLFITDNDIVNESVNSGISDSANYSVELLRLSKNSKIPALVAISDTARYESGDVETTKGSTGGPAVWDGAAWIDLT